MPRTKNRTSEFVLYSQTASQAQLIDMRAILGDALRLRFPKVVVTKSRARRVATQTQKVNGVATNQTTTEPLSEDHIRNITAHN